MSVGLEFIPENDGGAGILFRERKGPIWRQLRCASSDHSAQGPNMRSLIFALGLVAIAAPASAQVPNRGNVDLQTNCAGDALAFCAGIDPNSPQMDSCFKKNMSRMSPNCRRAIDAYEKAGGK